MKDSPDERRPLMEMLETAIQQAHVVRSPLTLQLLQMAYLNEQERLSEDQPRTSRKDTH